MCQEISSRYCNCRALPSDLAWSRKSATWSIAAMLANCAALLLVLGFVPAHAQQVPSPGQQLSEKELAAYGEYLAETCALCHSLDGKDTGIPSITGWPEQEFIMRINAYRSGDLENEVMINIARAFDRTDIQALALYLGSQATADGLKASLQPQVGSNGSVSARANVLGSVEEALFSTMPIERRALFCAEFQCSAAFLALK